MLVLLLSTPAGLPGRPKRPAGRRYVDDAAPPAADGIRRVSLARSKLIPQPVLAQAVRESGVLGRPASDPAVGALSDRLERWYRRSGYLFARVGKRVSQPGDSSHLVLLASEPEVARRPVKIEFFAPVAPDVDADAVAARPPAPPATRRWLAETALALAAVPREPPVLKGRFRDAAAAARLEAALARARASGAARPAALLRAEAQLVQRRRACGLPAISLLETLAARGEAVRCGGTTKEEAVARMLGLRPGEPWRLDEAGWQRLRSSPLFASVDAPRIGGAETAEGGDGSLQVRLQVVEQGARKGRPARFRALEPSVSLSRGSITGEVSLEDRNWRGANQQLSARVARANATEVSARLRDPSALVLRPKSRALSAASAGGTHLASDVRGFWRPLPGGEAAADAPREARAGGSCLLSAVAPRAAGLLVGGQLSAEHVPASGGGGGGGGSGGGEGRGGGRGDELPVLLEARATAGALRPPEAVAEAELRQRGGAVARGGAGGVFARLRERVSAGGELRLARALPLADPCPDFWRLSGRASLSSPLLPPAPPSPPSPPPAAPVARLPARPPVVMAARPGEMAETPPREAPALGSAAAAAASFARRMARTGRVSATARGKLASGGAPAYEAERLGGDGSVP